MWRFSFEKGFSNLDEQEAYAKTTAYEKAYPVLTLIHNKEVVTKKERQCEV